MLRGFRWPVLAAVWLCGPVFAQGEDLGPLNDQFSVSLGTFFMGSDTHVRADAFESSRSGTPFDFEDTFGLDDETVFRVDAAWRSGRRHILRAMYFNSDRSISNVIHEQIAFGDATFPLEAEVRADFQFDITELAYEYVFMDRDRYQLGASFGIHNAGFRIGLSSNPISQGANTGTSISESIHTNAPLPVLGLRGRWRLSERFYAMAHAQYFQLGFDAYEGDIQDYEAALVWQATRHVGLGAAYNLFRTKVETDDYDNFEGRLRWQYSGAQLFMRMSF